HPVPVGEDVLTLGYLHPPAELLAIELVQKFNLSFSEGENASRESHFDARLRVLLVDLHALLPGQRGAPNDHAAVDARGHEADAPVPAGVAGWLAHEVHVHALEAVGEVVLGEGQRDRVPG